MNNSLLLFTYGTLRRDCSSGAHQEYLHNARFVGFAKLRARLFLVSYYPGAVLADTNEWVYGEVYQLATAQQLARIDAYEECGTSLAPNQEYQRVSVTVTMDDNASQLTVWAYIYCRSTAQLPLISSGDFLQTQ